MTGLLIFFGILALLLALLAAPVTVRAAYYSTLTLQVRWLCFPLLRVPAKHKKEKPEKPPKARRKKPKKPKKPKPAKEKGPGPFARYYQYQGVAGYLALLRRVCAALQKFGRGVWRSFRVRRLWLHMVLVGSEPAELAQRYGKTCAGVFPALGWLSTHLRARPGAVRADVRPDFTGLGTKDMACIAEFTVCPLVLLAALLALLLRLALRVALKLLMGAKQGRQGKKTQNLPKRREHTLA
jgi:hypothetical protein